jgi:hypothetical protein
MLMPFLNVALAFRHRRRVADPTRDLHSERLNPFHDGSLDLDSSDQVAFPTATAELPFRAAFRGTPRRAFR